MATYLKGNGKFNISFRRSSFHHHRRRHNLFARMKYIQLTINPESKK